MPEKLLRKSPFSKFLRNFLLEKILLIWTGKTFFWNFSKFFGFEKIEKYSENLLNFLFQNHSFSQFAQNRFCYFCFFAFFVLDKKTNINLKLVQQDKKWKFSKDFFGNFFPWSWVQPSSEKNFTKKNLFTLKNHWKKSER